MQSARPRKAQQWMMGVIKHPAGETGNPEPTNRRNLSLSSLSILSSLKLCCLHKFLLDHSLPSSILSQPTIGRYLFYLYHSLLSTNHQWWFLLPSHPFCHVFVSIFLSTYLSHPPLFSLFTQIRSLLIIWWRLPIVQRFLLPDFQFPLAPIVHQNDAFHIYDLCITECNDHQNDAFQVKYLWSLHRCTHCAVEPCIPKTQMILHQTMQRLAEGYIWRQSFDGLSIM